MILSVLEESTGTHAGYYASCYVVWHESAVWTLAIPTIYALCYPTTAL